MHMHPCWHSAGTHALLQYQPASFFLQVKDPRVSVADNNGFLDLMEQYFSNEDAAKEDTRPELCYQVQGSKIADGLVSWLFC